MNTFGPLDLRSGGLLCGAILIGAALAANPATAAGMSSLLQTFGINTCNSPNPCLGYQNNGTGLGLEGIAQSSNGVGGATLNASSTTNKGWAGVKGSDNSTDGGTLNVGVNGTARTGIGVFGISLSNNGVVGGSSNANGVRGTTKGLTQATKPASGVIGEDNSPISIEFNVGVTGTSPHGTGVFGQSLTGVGVHGYTHAPSRTKPAQSGVLGEDLSTDHGMLNAGVTGSSNNGTGVNGVSNTGYGVTGRSNGSAGVLAENLSTGYGLDAGSTGTAVHAYGDIGPGVRAQSNSDSAVSAMSTLGDKMPTIAATGGTTTKAGLSLATYDSAGSATFWVDNAGNAHVRGQIFTGGSCSSGCLERGHGTSANVARYTPQEAAPTIEDVGEASLSNGSAFVRIDRAFANVMDSKKGYVVFITPEGPNTGLYVTDRTAQGFRVEESPGGHGSIAFAYRIVANPAGVSAPRLPPLSASDGAAASSPAQRSVPR